MITDNDVAVQGKLSLKKSLNFEQNKPRKQKVRFYLFNTVN